MDSVTGEKAPDVDGQAWERIDFQKCQHLYEGATCVEVTRQGQWLRFVFRKGERMFALSARSGPSYFYEVTE